MIYLTEKQWIRKWRQLYHDLRWNEGLPDERALKRARRQMVREHGPCPHPEESPNRFDTLTKLEPAPQRRSRMPKRKWSLWVAVKKGVRSLIELFISAGLVAVIAALLDPAWLVGHGVPLEWTPVALFLVRMLTNRLKQTPLWRRLPGTL